MARAMPQAGQGSGEPVAQRARLPQTGVNSPYDTKALFKLNNSPDRLSEDIAAAFADAITAGATPAAATRAAFSAWYRSPWRLERYRAAAVGSHLDRLDDAKAIPTVARLPPDHFDRMCLMPDGSNYGCHLTEEIEIRDVARR